MDHSSSLKFQLCFSRQQYIERNVFVLTVRQSSSDIDRQNFLIKFRYCDLNRIVNGRWYFDEGRGSKSELERSSAYYPCFLKTSKLRRPNRNFKTIFAFLLRCLCLSSFDFLRGRYSTTGNSRQNAKKTSGIYKLLFS